MDIIAISDIYGDKHIVQEFTKYVEQNIKSKPIIIIAGDIGINASSSQYYHQKVNEIFDILLDISENIFYIPGDSDEKNLKINTSHVKNIDRRNVIIENEGVKVGLLGLGGAPYQSMRNIDLSPYLWDENLPLIRENILIELKIQVEKIAQEKPDYIMLVSHSPPYGIADRSKPITLHEMNIIEDILEEIRGETMQEREATQKTPTSIRHLGSKVISDFIKYYKPDIHIFGHVHKEGGKTKTYEATKFFNVSHLSPLPYKLTGRKFLKMKITKENVLTSFDHVVTSNLPFDVFIQTYL